VYTVQHILNVEKSEVQSTQYSRSGQQANHQVSAGRSRLILHWLVKYLKRTFFNQYSFLLHSTDQSITSYQEIF